jgi:hypothetical protein
MSPWRDHNSGFCPVDGKAIVRVRWANGTLASQDYPANNLRWSKRDDDYDIASFQVTSTEEVE